MLQRLRHYLRFYLGMGPIERKAYPALLLLVLSYFLIRWAWDAHQYRQMRWEIQTMVIPALPSQPGKKTKFPRPYADRPGFRQSNKYKSYSNNFHPWHGKAGYARPPRGWPKSGKSFAPINLNAADSLELLALPGIGPVLSGRILKYREALGGFHSSQQLKEVFGLDSLWWKQYQAQLNVGRGIYRWMPINRLDWAGLKHPYLKPDQRKIWLRFRSRNGPIRQFEELKLVYGLDLNQWERLRPYLIFD